MIVRQMVRWSIVWNLTPREESSWWFSENSRWKAKGTMKGHGGGSFECLVCCAGLSRVLWLFILSIILSTGLGQSQILDNSTNVYVGQCYASCASQKDAMSCGRYRLVRWLHGVSQRKEFRYGPIRLIRIPSIAEQSVLPKVPRSRVLRSDIIDALNFLRNIAEDLLTRRAIVYTIDNPTRGRSDFSIPWVLDDDELDQIDSKNDGQWRIFKKKKKSLILPLLILLNLFKLKLLLLPIFLGVHFIKKILVLAGLVVPSILKHLKICKVPQAHQSYPYHTWSTAAEAPVDYPSGFAHDDGAWAHRNDYQGHLGYPALHAFRNPYG